MFLTWNRNLNLSKFRQRKASTHLFTEFKILFRFGLIFGLPFSPDILNSSKRDLSYPCRIYVIVLIGFKILLYLSCTTSLQNITGFSLLGIVVHVFNACTMIVLLLMFSHRKSLYRAIHDAIRIAPDVKKGDKWFWTVFVVSGLIACLISTSLSVFLAFLRPDRQTNMKFFGTGLDEDLQAIITYSHCASVGITYVHGLLTFLFLTFLCSKTFHFLSEGARSFREALAREMRGPPQDEKNVQKYLIGFSRVVDCSNSVESAFSSLNLFLVGYCVSSFFLVFSAIAARDPQYDDPQVMAMIVLSFLLSLLEFTSVCWSAEKIRREDRELKKLVIRCSERALRICDHEPGAIPKIQYFSLLADVIRGTTLEVTGGQMFVMNNSLISTVCGVMITYGVLIFQFGDN